ncbi:TetR/AcrR family transcriptional regulator [Halieaceae bacterium IMCC14734]|uniref:TetR/AcrR family transcriptional regulator n=1 Tax=Candidatus Litorirhabdus singularis TaxID=2518993 RepID=A0ABT3TE71_9GAMM|nr:TetR/AcrR family transcriptional regulator [Candidatus Litorirhabdus singularis]MCX2980120.1 TetR/AcrR family transcriptional regulator [Candidatus Litorirhabdus singularis]
MGLRETKKRRIAESVLKAAQRLFLEQGVAATTMQAIAGDAGISRASLFNYYPGKEVIVAALAARMEPRLVQLVHHYQSRTATTGECIDALFDHLAKVVGPTVELTRLLFVQGNGGVAYPQLAAALTDLVSNGQRQGDVRSDKSAPALSELLYLEVVACLLGWAFTEQMSERELFRRRAELVKANLLV